MRDFYKKHFHKEDEDCKKKKTNKFVFILLGIVIFVYFVLQMKNKNNNQDYKNVKLISSKLSTNTSGLSTDEKLLLLEQNDSTEYIVSAELINQSSSNTFIIAAFLESKDTIYSQRKTYQLDSNVITKVNIQFPKMKRLTGKRKYKVGIVK